MKLTQRLLNRVTRIFKGIFSARKQAAPSALDKAERAIEAQNYPALSAATAEIANLVPTYQYLAEPLLILGQRLAQIQDYVPHAIEAVRIAASWAPADSDFRRQAVSTWAKYVDELPDVSLRIEAAKVAARSFNSDLKRQAVSTWAKYVDALPEAWQRVQAAEVAADSDEIDSDLERQARQKLREFRKQQPPAPPVPSTAASQYFVTKFHL